MSRGGWQVLGYDALKVTVPNLNLAQKEAATVLIRRPDGTCIVGRVVEINKLAFKVVNGEVSEIVPFSNQLVMFQLLEAPSERTWKRGESQLGLKLDN